MSTTKKDSLDRIGHYLCTYVLPELLKREDPRDIVEALILCGTTVAEDKGFISSDRMMLLFLHCGQMSVNARNKEEQSAPKETPHP